MNPRMRRGARLLGSGFSVGQVAEELGVHRATVSRWCRNEEFRRAMELHVETEDAEARRLWSRLYCRVVETLSEALCSGDVEIRLRAARVYLQRRERAEQLDLQRRQIEALEQLRDRPFLTKDGELDENAVLGQMERVDALIGSSRKSIDAENEARQTLGQMRPNATNCDASASTG